MDFNYNIIADIQNKWENTLDKEISLYTMEKALRHIQEMKEGPFTKYLQFKMLHKRIVTNKKTV